MSIAPAIPYVKKNRFITINGMKKTKTDDISSDWRPLITAAKKKSCLIAFENHPILKRVGLTLDGVAAMCIDRHFHVMAEDLAESIRKCVGDQEEESVRKPAITKKSKVSGNETKKATETQESSGATASTTPGDAANTASKPVDEIDSGNAEPGAENKQDGDAPINEDKC